MRYLITTTDGNPPFMSDHFDPENNFIPNSGMIVYDLYMMQYTTDGVNWNGDLIDHIYNQSNNGTQ